MRPPSDQELRLLLLRLSRKLPQRLKVLEADNTRNIKLGLERVKRAVPQHQKWKGIHVAGTNGKGSICAYLSGLFTLAGKSYGRFTSPAFPEKRHGVVINGEAVRQAMYDHEMEAVLHRYDKLLRGFEVTSGQKPGPLTPFEIDTATAFRIFNTLDVPYGIVEVGMGGGTDATNAMKSKAVTIISKIGVDHAEYLGRNIEEIASVKAGIMAKSIPCIVDHTNEPEVMKVLEKHAWRTGSPLILSSKSQSILNSLDNDTWKLEDWQQQNLLCAITAFHNLFPNVVIDINSLMALNPTLPGRMQTVLVSPQNQDSQEMRVLVDGAHNPLATQKLGRYVDRNLRVDNEPVTWIIGFSQSDTKPFREMLRHILRPQDNVAFVEFAQQTNEPPPVSAAIGRQWAQECLGQAESAQLLPSDYSLTEAVEWARQRSGGNGSVVVTGSLYLMRDFLNLPVVQSDSQGLTTRRVGSTAFKSLRQKKSREGLAGEELEQYLRTKREVFDPRDKARRKRSMARKNESALDSSVGTESHVKPDPEQSKTSAPLAEDTEESNSGPSKTPFKGIAHEVVSSQDPVERKEKPSKKHKQVLSTPFWRDPENPSMSLPNPNGQPSQKALKQAAWIAKVKQHHKLQQRRQREAELQSNNGMGPQQGGEETDSAGTSHGISDGGNGASRTQHQEAEHLTKQG
ncbi:hypothetical protein NLU13_5594 [Sarocladium strictum]|uniref:Mur ligase central domain-containing protein n=1 Tax=Sarocladium strictum TaxID=5046 RepID=A0AA39GHS2_SARSR|nr:hypothetical protein NLU13_5594 [Sarocladium strictum]